MNDPLLTDKQLNKWQAGEIQRLQALHLDRTKSTHKALTERDEKISRLSSEGALKDKALRNARAALDTLPAEALGTAERDGIQWFLRDELVSEIVKALVSEGLATGESK